MCIVGAGAAGISIAREFLDTNVSVVMLEGGHLEADGATQALNDGVVTGLNYPLATSRLRFFGGTTNHWAGQSCPMEEIDFQHRPWVPNSGWPIEFEDYVRYVERAKRICQLTDRPFAWENWKDSVDFPLSQEMFHPLLLQYPIPKPRFGQDYREDIANANNIRCILDANATNIESNVEHTVDYIDVKSLNGVSAKVQARKFILACGAIQNVKLLLNSRNRFPHGIGNVHGNVGKYFMEHPNYDTGIIELRDPSAYPMIAKPIRRFTEEKIRYDFRLVEALQEKYKVLNHSLFLRPAARTPSGNTLGGQTAQFWHRTDNKADGDTSREIYTLRVRLEHAPIENSWVSLSKEKDALGLYNPKLHLQIGDMETHTVAVVQEVLAKALGARNIGRMKINFEPAKNKWKYQVGWQYHHLGGTRMSKNPEQGVVDENCKVHSSTNLYIASSSIFPTGGHANPTMNIVAFALRLAEHLKQEMYVS